jgi:hypothetical protein
MRRISSRATLLVKRPLLVLLIWLLLFVLADELVRGLIPGQLVALLLLLVPILMYLFFYGFLYFVIRRRGLLNFVDQVSYVGDALIVRNGNQEDRIALTEVASVRHSYPYRVTLMLRRPTTFGTQIQFLRPWRFLPFLRNREIDDLMDRINALTRA